MLQDLETLDLAGTVAGAAGCVQAEITAGCQLLEYAVHWAILNPGDGASFEDRVEKYGERNVFIAGDGTPDIAEFAIADFGLEIRHNIYQARALIADALDLRYRLPCTWMRVQHARVPARLARRLAVQTRRLSKRQAQILDRRISADLATLSARRLDTRIEAEIKTRRPGDRRTADRSRQQEPALPGQQTRPLRTM
jgi:hypothetical protein